MSRPRGLALILLVAFLAQLVVGLWHGLEVRSDAPPVTLADTNTHDCDCGHETPDSPSPAPCDDGCGHDPSSCDVCRTLLLLTNTAFDPAPLPTVAAAGPGVQATPLPDLVIRRVSVRVAHPRGPPPAA